MSPIAVNDAMRMKATSQESSIPTTEEPILMQLDKNPDDANSLVSRLIESALEQNGNNKTPTPNSEEESRLAKAFPWLTDFNKLCQAEIGTTNINTLENLMTIYQQNVSKCVSECYVKPNRAAKLKRCMNDTLLLFHMFYSDIKKPLEHSSYLDKMSDLMAMYMDMEIKASRREKESLPKIASKLTSSLYIFLDRSQDHILDSILKTKYMNKSFRKLCGLIFSRVLRDSPGRAVYEMTYVRYVLAFKMWKKVVKGPEERRNIMKMATAKLFAPSQFREKLKAGLLSGVLPKIPKSRKDITVFLMQAKFCVKESTKAFLKAVADPKQQGVLGSQLAADLDRPLFFGGGDTDASRTSNSDEQEDTSGSTLLVMNDIWSSITESGISDHLRLASVVTSKAKKQVKNKSRKNVIKCKGIATPVFKTDPGVTENANNTSVTDKCKKKKKKTCKDKNDESTADDKAPEVVSVVTPEITEVPPEPAVAKDDGVIEVCSSEDVGKQKDIPPQPAPPQVTTEKNNNEIIVPTQIENEIQIPVVTNIKVEPESDDVCIIGYVNTKDKEQVNQVDSVCQGDKDNEMLEVAEEVEIRCDSENVPAEPSASNLPCQQAVVSPVKVENTVTTAETVEGQSSHIRDISLYDEQTPTVWSHAHPQGYYNNAVNDCISEYLVHSKLREFDIESAAMELRDIYEMFDMNKSLNIRPKETSFQMRGDNVLGDLSYVPIEYEVSDVSRNRAFASNSGSVPPDAKGTFIRPQVSSQRDVDMDPHLDEHHHVLNQELINSMLESFREQVRNCDKNLVKNQPPPDVAKVVAEVQAKSKDKGMLHDRTLRRDHSIFISQQNFRSLYIIQNLPPTTVVPSPLELDPASLTPVPRCHCPQCYANQIALITNYRILTHYKNSKMNNDAALRKCQNDELLKKIKTSVKEDKVIKDECKDEQDSSLPLKKRKAFACSTPKKEVIEPSYPCTPMISIAALEENKNNMKPINYETKMHTGPVSMDYTVATTSSYSGYTSTPVTEPPPTIKPYNTVIVQNTKPKPAIDNIVSGTYTPFQPPPVLPDDRIRFKTPAQLKEGSTGRPAPEITAAQNLINFAQNSHRYYNSQQTTTETKSSKHKHRSRSDRQQSRKRKQN